MQGIGPPRFGSRRSQSGRTTLGSRPGRQHGCATSSGSGSLHRRLGNQHHASQFNRRTVGVTGSLKANIQVNVKVSATSTDESEQPVRSGCQGALDGSHILTGCVACKIAATRLRPVADCHLKAVGDGWASAQQPHTSVGCSLNQPPPSMRMDAPTTLGRQMGARNGSSTGLSRTWQVGSVVRGRRPKAIQIGGFELPDWTGPVELRARR